MATNIATLNVKLVASVGAFASTMGGAAKRVSSLGSSVALVGSKVLAFGGALTALAAGGSMAAMVKNSMEAIDANAKLADRLGFTTESLVGLQHAAGLAGTDAGALTGALEKMLNNLSDAATKGGPAADALAQLGLDAKALANGTPDAAFKSIAQGLSKVENPAQRASLAMDIFGKAGQGLLPLMMSGAEGIAAAQKEAERLGLTYSRVDAAKIEAANDSMTRMKSVVTGVGNQLAIGLAPFIDAAAQKMTALATEGGGIGPKVGAALEWVASGIATAADFLNLLKAGWKLMQAGATLAVLGVVKHIDLMGQSIVWVLNKLPGVSVEFTSFFSQMSDGLIQDVERLTSEAGAAFDSFNRGDNAKAVSGFFAGIRATSLDAAQAVADAAPKIGGAFQDIEDNAKDLKKVGDTLAELQKQAAQFGLSDSRKKIMDLEALGASPAQIAQAKELLSTQEQFNKLAGIDTGDPLADFAAKMESLQKLFAAGKVTAEQFGAIRDTAKDTLSDKLTDQAKGIIESVKTPLEQYQEEVDKLNVLLEQGLITQDVFDRATLKAKSAMDSGNGEQQAAPKILRAGSAEAQRFAFDQARGVQRLSKDEIPKKQYAEAQEQTTLLKQVVRNTRGDGDSDTTVVEI